jgi:hypothetical protein
MEEMTSVSIVITTANLGTGIAILPDSNPFINTNSANLNPNIITEASSNVTAKITLSSTIKSLNSFPG